MWKESYDLSKRVIVNLREIKLEENVILNL